MYGHWLITDKLRILLPTLLISILMPLHVHLVQANAPQEASPPAEASPQAKEAAGPRFVIRPADGMDGDYFTLEAEPGSTNELTVVLGNSDDESLSLRTYAADAIPNVNGGLALADAEADPSATGTWIDYPSETFTFEPGKGIERDFNVTVPDDVVPGQYVAGLALETAEPLPIEGASQFTQVIRKTIAVFIIVPGPEEPSFQLGDHQLVAESGFSSIEIPVENTGNVLVKPQGEFTLINEDGEAVLTAPIQMNSVYAGLTAPLVVTLYPPVPNGEYTLSLNLTDEETSTSASIDSETISIVNDNGAPEPFELAGEVNLQPDLKEPVFAQVAVTVTNNGNAASSELLLDVMKDGKLVETFTLASSLSLPPGETAVSQRYIPLDGFAPGTWSFVLHLNVVDHSTGATTSAATLEGIPEIEVGE